MPYLYFTALFAAALFAAEHASLADWSSGDSVYVSGTVMSHAIGLPRAQGSNVVPSGHFPSYYYYYYYYYTKI